VPARRAQQKECILNIEAAVPAGGLGPQNTRPPAPPSRASQTPELSRASQTAPLRQPQASQTPPSHPSQSSQTPLTPVRSFPNSSLLQSQASPTPLLHPVRAAQTPPLHQSQRFPNCSFAPVARGRTAPSRGGLGEDIFREDIASRGSLGEDISREDIESRGDLGMASLQQEALGKTSLQEEDLGKTLPQEEALGKTSPILSSLFSSPSASNWMLRASLVGTPLMLTASLVGTCTPPLPPVNRCGTKLPRVRDWCGTKLGAGRSFSPFHPSLSLSHYGAPLRRRTHTHYGSNQGGRARG
jgi:hypothetical protein